MLGRIADRLDAEAQYADGGDDSQRDVSDRTGAITATVYRGLAVILREEGKKE